LRPGRRKPKWYENPPPSKACRFDSDLGHHKAIVATAKELPVISPDEWLLRKLSRKPGTADYTWGSPPDGGFAQDPLVWLKAEYPEFEASVRGKRVADFGCGEGAQAIALARTYQCRVVGIDNYPPTLAQAVKSAREQQMDGQVAFCDSAAPDMFGTFDVVISQNSMEHYPQPDAALETMRRLVHPGGQIMLTFGPPWFAPWGAHMLYFCRVPWVHLLFREQTVLSVRASYRPARLHSYEECGLNRMSLRRFETLLSEAGLVIGYIKYHGVRGQDWVKDIPLVRELLVNQVTCLLTRLH
jgi:SAM-dependent methyltransferase